MARVTTDLSNVLIAAKNVLVGNGVFTSQQCFLTVEPDEILSGGTAKPEPPVAGLTFVGFSQRPDTYQSEMAEGDAPTMEGDLVVAIWIRSGLDQPARDASFITNASIGASQLVQQVQASLSNVELTNDDGDGILWRTLNYTGVTQRGRWSTDKRWRRVDVRFNCVFEWSATPVDPITPITTPGQAVFAPPAFETPFAVPVFE